MQQKKLISLDELNICGLSKSTMNVYLSNNGSFPKERFIIFVNISTPNHYADIFRNVFQSLCDDFWGTDEIVMISSKVSLFNLKTSRFLGINSFNHLVLGN